MQHTHTHSLTHTLSPPHKKQKYRRYFVFSTRTGHPLSKLIKNPATDKNKTGGVHTKECVVNLLFLYIKLSHFGLVFTLVY